MDFGPSVSTVPKIPLAIFLRPNITRDGAIINTKKPGQKPGFFNGVRFLGIDPEKPFFGILKAKQIELCTSNIPAAVLFYAFFFFINQYTNTAMPASGITSSSNHHQLFVPEEGAEGSVAPQLHVPSSL